MDIRNISKNDLAKYQGYLKEIAEAYSSSRTGWHDANKAVLARVENLSDFLAIMHKQSDHLNEIDEKLLPTLQHRVVKFNAEISAAKTENEKTQLQARKAATQARIDEIIALKA